MQADMLCLRCAGPALSYACCFSTKAQTRLQHVLSKLHQDQEEEVTEVPAPKAPKAKSQASVLGGLDSWKLVGGQAH